LKMYSPWWSGEWEEKSFLLHPPTRESRQKK
jgi:hypothetical protein